MILFIEDKTFGYKSRTLKNAEADATIAIAIDFSTAGEKFTKQSVLSLGKQYIPVNFNKIIESTESTINLLNNSKKQNIVLNIAGNGIYTFHTKHITQDAVDEMVYVFLKDIINSDDLKVKICGIRTGGQTGVDEAGAKAGEHLNIPTLVLAPKNWVFRDINGMDISDEILFKTRFVNNLENI